jgi:hypothetical protein
MTPQPNTEEGNEKAKDIVLDLINGIFGNVIGSSLTCSNVLIINVYMEN